MSNCNSNSNSNSCTTIQCFIDTSFIGAVITVRLVNGSTITGEVVQLSNSVVALKSGSTTNYLNPNFIVSFF